jgi:hypothetical protein
VATIRRSQTDAPRRHPASLGPGIMKRVVVLQAGQPIGSGMVRAFPSPEWRVDVWTTGPVNRVFRDPTPPSPVRLTEIGSLDINELTLRLTSTGSGVEVVTNDEFCLKACLELRHRLGLTTRVPRTLEPWVDKLEMKQRLASALIRTPRFMNLDLDPAAPSSREVAHRLGLPLVVKPRQGANNRGIEVLASIAALERWLADHAGEPGWHAESFVTGDLFHANALVIDGVVHPVQVGRYTSPPLYLKAGRPVGSVTLPDDDRIAIAGTELNGRVVDALGGAGSFAVHTEFFVTETGVTVLETAARAPGGLVSEIAAIRTGIHLEEASLRLQVAAPLMTNRRTGPYAAWMWFTDGEILVGDVVRRLALRSACEVRKQATPVPAAILAWNHSLTDLLHDIATLEGHSSARGHQK